MNYSIIVPIYKEEKNISKLIHKIKKELKGKIVYELIFVDDDSRDQSKNIFNKYSDKNFKFYIRKNKPRDLSKSVVYGFEKSKYNNLIVMDGDLQHNPRDILKFIKVFEKTNCDIVIGCRKLANYKKANLNPVRFIFSKSLNHVFNFIFNHKISDPMSGFFLIKKEVYNKVKTKLILLGYKILIDIILSARKNILIKEVKINFSVRDKGFSKMRLKILLQLLVFIFIKYFKYEKKN
jgi:dolichol-phosphate mannosyltransferase